tara:strand:+ start:37864 stop:38103 length:240 start_codon:yes stop_codon:yes gene_type:complete
MVRKKVNIPAIHDKDLQDILKEFNLLDRINLGEITCLNCSKEITIENLGGLVSKDGGIKVFCDDPECIALETPNNELYE